MGVTVQCDTEGKELMVEDGKVVGAIAQGSDGTTYEIKADYVLLATGGYGNNPEMLDHAEGTVYYGPAGLTGDGQKMAEAVGAKLVNMGGIAMKPVNLEVEEGVAKNASAARLGFETIPAILVADDGERIANELAGEAEMRDAWIAHETESLFMLMDEAAYEAFVQNGLDTELIGEYLNIKVLSPVKGNKKKIVDMAINNAKILLNEKFELIKKDEEKTTLANEELRKVLKLPKLERIEIFDNSLIFLQLQNIHFINFL